MSETASPFEEQIKGDRILRTYYVREKKICFDASNFFSPISIRDQIIRACLIVERAKLIGIIAEDRPLLIIGGGVTGITAAIKAVELGIKVTLTNNVTFAEGLGQSARYFCPIQYDWPAEHWDAGKFPWSEEPSLSIPVILSEGPVQKSIQGIQNSFILLSEKEKKFLSYYPNVIFKTVKFPDGAVDQSGNQVLEAVFEKNIHDDFVEEDIELPDELKFGMALSCVGFGAEKTFTKETDNFHGIRFWTLADHSKFLEQGNVLICGGGDGALQDFLLLSTHKQTAKEIYQFLREAEPPEIKSIFEEAKESIRFAEDKSKRDEMLQDSKQLLGKQNLCRIYRELQSEYQKQVDILYEKDFIQTKLKSLVVAEVLQGKLQLAFSCDHFSACYPLNRFLVLLIGKFISEDLKRNEINKGVFLSGTSVKVVSSADEGKHICEKNASVCDGFSHKVLLASNNTCVDKKSELEEQIFRRVIIRYGIKETVKIFGAEPSFPGLQLLPYTLR